MTIDTFKRGVSVKHINIAIDGPVGAGKSTVAKILAEKLGFMYFDTGATFRMVALKAINSGIDTTDKDGVLEILENMDIAVRFEEGEQVNCLDGVNVNSMIRTPEVSMGASNVGVIPEVRAKLVEIWRDVASRNNVVMEGRDIGTFVLPDADYKFFLTASVEERARRRHSEMVNKGERNVNFEQVKQDVEKRDKQDSTRAVAPLRMADDAVVVDSTDIGVEEVICMMLSHIRGNI